MIVWIVVVTVAAAGLWYAWQWIHFTRTWPKVFNIVMAKATYAQLPANQRDLVAKRAVELVRRAWTRRDVQFTDDLFLHEAHRLSWHALAMAELGIAPLRNRMNAGWYVVKKPHQCPYKPDSIYENIVSRLRDESKIEVAIDFPVTVANKPSATSKSESSLEA